VRFDQAPFLVIWEVTRACDLACLHCRADAAPHRHAKELSTDEGFALIREIRRFGHPLFVLTGGDPLKRPDIFQLIAYAKELGLQPGLSPSATPLLQPEALRRAKEAGAGIVSISIDAPVAADHDAFRGVPGSFDLSMAAARAIVDLGLRLQINTVVTADNADRLGAIAELVASLGASRWEVFFLVPTGRGAALHLPTPAVAERVLHQLADLADEAPFHLTVVEAPFYRRVVLQRQAAAEGRPVSEILRESATGGGRFLPGMNSGKGFCFIAHDGTVQPSGFLPLPVANVRTASLVDTYRDAPAFGALRAPEQLRGKCGRCMFRVLCGGSRARAFALTGDPLAADSLCDYEPPQATESPHCLVA
jgi:radical SAM protein